ncbi:MAG: FAD-dependent monooxygenase [Microbacterium sp.]
MAERTTVPGEVAAARAISSGASLRTKVAVIGAGPTGAALALGLGRQGVDTILVDAHREPRRGVRAGGFTSRGMEVLRVLGVADDIRDRAAVRKGWPATSVVTTGLASGALVAAPTGAPSTVYAPAEIRQNVQAWVTEAVMREHIDTCPSVTTLYGREFAGDLRQHNDHVHLTVLDWFGNPSELRADYVVAADGVNSIVREVLGVPITGARRFRVHHTIEFIAPGFGRAHALGEHNQYQVYTDRMLAYFLHQDMGNRWTMQIEEIDPNIADLVLTDPVSIIRMALGHDDVEIEWAAGRRWKANAFWTSTQRVGRVFLAGDAAHPTPPGGLGVQLGLTDALDIAWKLGAVCRGWGGPKLLDSITDERLPINRAVVQRVDTSPSLRHLAFVGLEGDALNEAVLASVEARDRHRGDSNIISHGAVYRDSPVVVMDVESAPPAGLFSDNPCAELAKQIPHREVFGGRALLDLPGWGFALLVAEAEHAIKFEAAAQRLGIPLSVAAIGSDVVAELVGHRRSCSILLRPDAFVAWMGDVSDVDPAYVLSTAAGQKAPAQVGG